MGGVEEGGDRGFELVVELLHVGGGAALQEGEVGLQGDEVERWEE